MQKLYIYLILLTSVLFAACKKYTDDTFETTSLVFNFDADILEPNENLSYGLFTLSNADNTVSLTNKQLSFTLNGDIYESEILELPAGDYSFESIVLNNHKDEMVLLVPKSDSEVGKSTGDSLPSKTGLKKNNHNRIPIRPRSPYKLGMHPHKFGYSEFADWRVPPTPTPEFNGEICLRIGVPAISYIPEPIIFQVKADNSVVLSGICSGGTVEYTLPLAKQAYTISTILPHDTINQIFTVPEVTPFTCKASEYNFINILDHKYKEPFTPSAQIVVIKQTQISSSEYIVSYIDTNGIVLTHKAPKGIVDDDFDGIIEIDKQQYDKLRQAKGFKIGEVDKEELKRKHQAVLHETVKITEPYTAKVEAFAIEITPDKIIAKLIKIDGKLSIDGNLPPNYIDFQKWMVDNNFWGSGFFYGRNDPPGGYNSF